MKVPQFIIAAPTSNAGKTTLTLAMLRALKNRGLAPQSFKCGPDYIDPKFHEVAGDKRGINLDLFMMSESHMEEVYRQGSVDAKAVCIEGVMGLFDGAKKSKGSTAEIAKSLGLPIILVVDAKSVAYSVAPLLYGFKNFDPELNIAGVIFNRVNTDSHYQFLMEACADVGIKAFGRMPYLKECEIPSRHLGLSIDQLSQYDQVIEQFANELEANVDIGALLQQCTKELENPKPKLSNQTANLSIAVAADEGFNFSYYQNIQALKQIGEVTYFSPIHDEQLPDSDLVYIPGGYPELYLSALSRNESMRQSVYDFAQSGGAIIAECGGLMYLGKSITDKEGKTYEMAGVFDFTTSMESMKLSLGYRTIEMNGAVFKGHEFHYSVIEGAEQVNTQGHIINARGAEAKSKVYRYKNVWASYIHLYFGEEETLQELLEAVNLKREWLNVGE